MTINSRNKIGKWAGNILLFLSCVLVIYSYLNLYNNGHKQCIKPELEKTTFLVTSSSYALIFFIIGQRLSKKFGERRKVTATKSKLNKFATIVLGLILLIGFLIVTSKIQFIIEDTVEAKIRKQLEVDGVTQEGIVLSYRSIFSSGKGGRRIEYDQIEFKYISDQKTRYACYSIEYGRKEKCKIGDTLDFIISKSNPEYILLGE